MSPEEPSIVCSVDTLKRAQDVQSREDLVRFLADLSVEVHAGRVVADNGSAGDLLDAASGWVADMDGFFVNRGEEAPSSPTWGLIAMIFAASLVYE